MDDNKVWQAIDEERLRLAEVLDQLTEKEWRHQSLCEGWTVCDVVAHLTLQQIGLRGDGNVDPRPETTRHKPDDQRRRLPARRNRYLHDSVHSAPGQDRCGIGIASSW
jgi:uncharacterized protein (TIGR03083 family)